MSLTRRVGHGQEVIQLPRNTFAGILRGQNAQEVIDRVKAEFDRSSFLDGLRGRYFIAATPNDATNFAGGTF